MNIAVSLLDCLYLYATNDITQKDWNAIMYIVLAGLKPVSIIRRNTSVNTAIPDPSSSAPGAVPLFCTLPLIESRCAPITTDSCPPSVPGIVTMIDCWG